MDIFAGLSLISLGVLSMKTKDKMSEILGVVYFISGAFILVRSFSF